MKLFVVFTTFLLSYTLCQSQSKELVQYYFWVNNAEKKISEGSYAEAYSNYRNAFKLKERPFEADIINYLKISILNKNIKQLKADPFLRDNREIINSIENDLFLKKNHNIFSFITSDTLFKENPEKILFTVQIDSIFEIDQAIRHVCDNDSEPCKTRIKITDSTTMSMLLALFEKHGLSEIICNRDCMRKIYVILLHSRRWGYLQGDSYLIKYIKEGNIKQGIFALLNPIESNIDSVNKHAFDKRLDIGRDVEYFIFNDTLLHFKVRQGFIDSCNKNRASIMMAPVEEDEKKLQSLMDKYSPFYNCYWDFGFQKNSYDIPKDVFNSMIKKWIDEKRLIQ